MATERTRLSQQIDLSSFELPGVDLRCLNCPALLAEDISVDHEPAEYSICRNMVVVKSIVESEFGCRKGPHDNGEEILFTL